ncbi:hypothetical protein A5697_03725 [Mycobacterium sp. E3251]|uniref:hypothetical protein n=1 Tax=unclassified Mycobacterium TaxID=2642494 RepID=UPI0007FB89E4|nr:MULTISPECIES: hypothetical protein [unclassified Mycobacterium]OBG93798.1 hypothetical protein A5697_03725 [Mycobacterium sp. E3251]OBI35639.1 hypothetical protein A5711_15695 [Mycobacterium sp. E2238]
MNRSTWVRRGPVTAIRERLSVVIGQSERTFLLGAILLVTAFSAVVGYVLSQCYSVDIVTSLLSVPEDCFGNWGTTTGRHCFGDYAMVVGAGLRPNPWEPYAMFPPHAPFLPAGPPAGMLPHLLFGFPAKLLGVPRLGLIGYLLALTAAVLSPAVWAARGACGLERVVVFVALSTAAIPVWAVIDRANSAGFLVPIALVFLVALCRQRWGLVAIMVVLAAVVKPQFAALVVALFAARQWRVSGLAIAGVAVSQFGAYLLWPRDFPGTIAQSIHNVITGSGLYLTDMRNVAFGRALTLLPDYAQLAQTGKMSSSYLAAPRAYFGYVVVLLVVVAVVALGRRIPPVMVGIVLLATLTLAPPLVIFYYLVFALPIAALIVRDPDGPAGAGIFDKLSAQDGGPRRAVSIWLSLATALSMALIPLGTIGRTTIPGQAAVRLVVDTTAFVTPFLWLIACTVIIVSYARRPALSPTCGPGPAQEESPDTAITVSSSISEETPKSSPQGAT